MRYLNYLAGLVAVCFALNAQSQIFINDSDYNQSNPLNCGELSAGGPTNFYDMGGNYAPNMDEVITLCPDLSQGSKVSIAFATNIGFEFNVHPSDTLYIYDGPNTAAPLLGAYNSGTDPTGFFVQASFENNPSGCLTVRFVSDGVDEGTGWVANVACGNAPQPFYPHIEAYKNGAGPNVLNPLDTGYVDMCLGDSILFVSHPDFPFSLENTGAGYSQTSENSDFTWTIGGQGALPVNNDSIWFTPTARQGYFVDLRILDPFPQPARITCKVRVSQLPLFAGTGPVEDTVCLGESTTLLGGVTPSDTVGVEIPAGEFTVGGTFAGLTALPDGSGAQYSTTIDMTGLDDAATITEGTDIASLCLDIEHSYIGDIEIALTCPNGTTVSIMNAYNGPGGLVPGGCGSGISTMLGNDTNEDGGAPGSPVWTYCFSQVNATFGTICSGVNTNTVTNDYGYTSMNPNGVFLPDGNFSDFIGCPLNGPWTITVQDNQGIDDGYIFQWGLIFDADLYPDPETYQNVIVSDFWSPDPTIYSGQNDTSIVVIPVVSGPHGYTYNVTDDFGCSYDTTVQLFTLPQPEIFTDTFACFLAFNITGTTAYSGGAWTVSDTAVHFSTAGLNPSIWVSVPGVYTLTFTDNACGTAVSSTIDFEPFVYTQVLDTVICLNFDYTIHAAPDPRATSFVWNTGETGTSININLSQPAEYIVTASNQCHSHTDTATIGVKECDIFAPNVIVLSSSDGNNKFFVNSQGVTEFNCVIVNRWGNPIYEYSDPAGSWDGKNSAGVTVDEGVYFYRIIATMESGVELTKQGFVQVYN